MALKMRLKIRLIQSYQIFFLPNNYWKNVTYSFLLVKKVFKNNKYSVYTTKYPYICELILLILNFNLFYLVNFIWQNEDY